MATRIESSDFAFFVTAVLIQRQTGGDLCEVLSNISGMIRQRIRLQQHVKAKTAEGRFTGYILIGVSGGDVRDRLTALNPELRRQCCLRPPIGLIAAGHGVRAADAGLCSRSRRSRRWLCKGLDEAIHERSERSSCSIGGTLSLVAYAFVNSRVCGGRQTSKLGAHRLGATPVRRRSGQDRQHPAGGRAASCRRHRHGRGPAVHAQEPRAACRRCAARPRARPASMPRRPAKLMQGFKLIFLFGGLIARLRHWAWSPTDMFLLWLPVRGAARIFRPQDLARSCSISAESEGS